MSIYFFQPVFHQKIWGGSTLTDYFHLKEDHIGEDWAISAHPHGLTKIINGELQGELLNQVWEKHPELFGNPTEKEFPLLMKILDAHEDLSVQVHPNDAYAKTHGGGLGKTECWYVIDAEPGAEIVYGHNAKTEEELRTMIDNGEWDKLLHHVPVKKGDFFYVPSGMIHAIGKGILILEPQQSSDTTYRLYDYDRKDANGHLRPLHLKEALDVITVPSTKVHENYQIKKINGNKITNFINSPFFSVTKLEVENPFQLEREGDFMLGTVVAGTGKITDNDQSYEVSFGSSFLIPNDTPFVDVVGNLTIILAHPNHQ